MEPEEVIADAIGSLILVVILLLVGAAIGGLTVGVWMHGHRPAPSAAAAGPEPVP